MEGYQAGSRQQLSNYKCERCGSKEKRRSKTEKMLFSWMVIVIILFLSFMLWRILSSIFFVLPNPIPVSLFLFSFLLTRIYVYISQAAKPQSLSSLKEAEELQQSLTSNAFADFTGCEWNWQFCNEVSGHNGEVGGVVDVKGEIDRERHLTLLVLAFYCSFSPIPS